MSTTEKNFLILSDNEGQFYAIHLFHLNQYRIVEDEKGSFKKHLTKNLVDNTTSHNNTPTDAEAFKVHGVLSKDSFKVVK